MSGWTGRERGLGAALVLAALAAFVVPAWADGPGEDSTAIEPATQAAAGGEGFLVPAHASRAEGDRMLAGRPSEEDLEQLEKFERCLGEHGIEPPPLPAEGEEPKAIPLPPPDEGFARAAEACGLPEAHVVPFGEAEDRGHRDELCSVPPPPPALRH